MDTLTFKLSSGHLESYEALLLQFEDPQTVAPYGMVELEFGAVTQIFPSAFALLAAYVGKTRDRSRRCVVSRRFGANPQSAKLERVMEAFGFISAVSTGKAADPRPKSGIVPLLPIDGDTAPEAIAARVIDIVTETAQPTRDAKEALFVMITEVVENILQHGQVDSPAYLCGQLSAQKRKLELCVVDAGVGIRGSYEGGKDEEARRRLKGGESALSLAVEPGCTSRGEGHTGLGLYVASEACRLNKGIFRVTSGGESLLISREGDKLREHARWNGTVVNMQYNLDKVGSLAEVFRPLPMADVASPRLKERSAPVPESVPTVALKGDVLYLGQRSAASAARARLLELVRAGGNGIADADGVATMTPGFVDDLFGELWDALGEQQFRESIAVVNATENVKLLIEAVLERRAGRSGSPAAPAATPGTEDPAGGEPAEEGVPDGSDQA